MFQRVGAGDWDAVMHGLARDIHHVFPGDHPLGGERHTKPAVRLWFERLGRLFPVHEFTVHRVVSRGWPWDTWVAVAWTARLCPQRGEPYENEGAHWINLRFGRASYFHAYLDTERVAEACRQMARDGFEEAAAAPIVD
jgi:ketosteroid isomerase-like protein